jgi:hypothetical protein
MISRATTAGLLPQPNEKVSAIGATLRAHWGATAAAAKAQFWTKPQNWLDVPRHYLNRITTSR